MDITSKNFESTLEIFKEKLKECDVMAIDLEMTGLHQGQPNIYLTPELLYQEMAQGPTIYNIIQVGVCCFKKQADGKFEVSPFNFYTQPKSYKPKGFKKQWDDFFLRNLAIDNSLMDFYKKNGFDFNKWLFESITYFDKHDMEKLNYQIMNLDYPPRNQPQNFSLTKSQTIKLLEIKQDFEEWYYTENSTEKSFIVESLCKFEIEFLKNRIFESLNDIKLEIQKNMSEVSEDSTLKVTKRSKSEEDQAGDDGALQEKINEYQNVIGFSKAWDEITACKKPVIFHNGLFDMIFLYSHFQEPLPRTLDEFKVKWRILFPKTYDTKYCCWLNPFPEDQGVQYRNRLEQVYVNLKEKEGILPESYYAEGMTRYEELTIYHEAAFDAMQTGMVFLAFCDQNPEIWNKALNRVKPFRNFICDHVYFGEDFSQEAIDPQPVEEVHYFALIDVEALKEDPEYFKKNKGFYETLIRKELGDDDKKIRLSKPNLFYSRKDSNYYTFVFRIKQEDYEAYSKILNEKMESLIKKHSEIKFMTVTQMKKYVQDNIIDADRGCKHWEISTSSAKFLKERTRDDLMWLKSNRDKKNIGDMIFKVLDYYIRDILRCFNSQENKHYLLKLRQKCYNELNWKGTDNKLVFDIEKFQQRFENYYQIASFIMKCKDDLDNEQFKFK